MSDNWVYTDTVKDHFMNPRNVLDNEEDFQPDGRGEVGNPKCGDQMLMVIKVNRETDTIADCRWKTYGCASAIASTSMLSEAVKGLKVEKAFHISPKDIAEKLGGLPENKIHCSVLGDKALKAAINDYFTKNDMKDRVILEEATIICQCMNITDHEIEEAVLEGVRTWQQLQHKTKIGTVCGQCRDEGEKVMNGYIQKHFS